MHADSHWMRKVEFRTNVCPQSPQSSGCSQLPHLIASNFTSDIATYHCRRYLLLLTQRHMSADSTEWQQSSTITRSTCLKMNRCLSQVPEVDSGRDQTKRRTCRQPRPLDESWSDGNETIVTLHFHEHLKGNTVEKCKKAIKQKGLRESQGTFSMP